MSAATTAPTTGGSIISVAANDAKNPVLTNIGFAVLANGPGTFAIGPVTSVANALLGVGSASWSASAGFGSGTVTITSLNSTSVAGTFTLNLEPLPGSTATGTRSVTNGSFNVRFTNPQ